MSDLLRSLLTAKDALIFADDVRGWWLAWSRSPWRREDPIDDAIAAGASADRLGFAFAGGYHAALRRLIPELEPDHLATLCATEEGGAHPRAIHASLTREGAGWSLTGQKRWSTLAPEAHELVVVASVGSDASGKNQLRLARIPRASDGITITPMPTTPFAPEIPHARVAFESVSVADDKLLEGDGWERYVKPFRTIEDLHVHGALLGYLIGVARRSGWAESEVERLLALVVTTRALAHEPADAPEVHVAVAGLLDLAARTVDGLDAEWQRVPDDERARWERDRGLLQVASAARSARKKRAWERLSGVEIAPVGT